MARVTIEDCEAVVQNRFDLVLLATQRARQINAGDPVTIEAKDEKRPVVALREIAAETVSAESLKESLINSFRSFLPDDSESEDVEDFEEDTYNPYIGMDIAQEGAQIVDNSSVVKEEVETESWDSDDDVETEEEIIEDEISEE